MAPASISCLHDGRRCAGLIGKGRAGRGRGQAGEIDVVLDGERNAVQRQRCPDRGGKFVAHAHAAHASSTLRIQMLMRGVRADSRSVAPPASAGVSAPERYALSQREIVRSQRHETLRLAAPAACRRRAHRRSAAPRIATTVPALSATTAISIFMASMITSASPLATCLSDRHLELPHAARDRRGDGHAAFGQSGCFSPDRRLLQAFGNSGGAPALALRIERARC